MADLQPQLRAVFCEALERKTAQEQADYLDQACAGKPDLRARVDALLRAHDEVSGFLQEPQDKPAVTTEERAASERPGTVIGPYRLLQQIGEGGMGVVWMAEQTQPVQRKVALKVIKPGMDSRQIIARFEAERQALAMMDHVNIARVLDAGATAAGLPYFVMELVHGVPITKYCDDNHLTPRERLELFVPVCQAIQHAHQKGIIHRDVKPSNIMVTLYDGKPVPKVIDFGVAKAIEQKLTERTLFTQYGTMVGTLEYMSPEQAEMSAMGVDTRSDIYSLGVLLYELLTGSTPLSHKRLKQAAFAEILRMIKEEEPPKPSTRLSDSGEALASISAQRHMEPAKLTKLVRGELDWIVMKTLEKDRNRRYETASGLADDVQRYLKDEQVQACPPSSVYRLKKFVRRNKGPVLAATVVVLALVAGIVGTTWGLLYAQSAQQAETQQRERAEQETRIAQAVRDFLRKKLLIQADTRHQADALREAGGDSAGVKYDPTIRELLDRAAAELAPDKIDAQFPNQPLVQAEILHTIGETYTGIGEYGLAIDPLKRALDLRQRQLAPDHRDTLDTMHNLAMAYHESGKLAEAIRLFEQVRDKRAVKLGPDHADTLTTQLSIASAYMSAGKLAEAIRLIEQVRDKRAEKLGPDHADTLTSLHFLALAYTQAGNLREAIRLFERVLDKRAVNLGPDHPHTVGTRSGLAVAYSKAGRFKEAIALNEETLKLRKDKRGPDDPHTLLSMHNLAVTYHNALRLKEAIALLEETLKRSEAKLGHDHPLTLLCMDSLGRAYCEASRFKEAVPILQKALKLKTDKLSRDHPSTLLSMNSLAWAYKGDGQHKEGVKLLDEAVKLSEVKLGRDHPDTLLQMHSLANALAADGQLKEALPLLEETVKLRRAKLGPEHWRTLQSMRDLAKAYGDRHDLLKEERLLREMLGLQRKALGMEWPALGFTPLNLGKNLLKQQKHGDAEPVLREWLANRVQNDPDHPTTFNAKSLLGDALLGQKKYTEAEPLLIEGYEGLKQRESKIPAIGKLRMTETLERLVQLYEAWDNADEAAKWRAELAARKAPSKDGKKPPPKK
jgi:serine/threonine protein kinase/tetratricopeptide (TPR) repeat protein